MCCWLEDSSGCGLREDNCFFDGYMFRWLQAFCNGSVARWRPFLRKLVFALERARFRLTFRPRIGYYPMSGW